MNEQQKIEELLKPRYEVIAPYPAYRGHGIEVGDILTDPGDNECVRNQKGQAVVAFHWDMFPHLFKPLQWWEKRSASDFTLWLRDVGDGEVFRVMQYNDNGEVYVFKNVKPNRDGGMPVTRTHCKHFTPCTESEYTAYINSKR